jgi:hypothetical protein
MERIFIDDRKNYKIIYNDGTVHKFNINDIRKGYSHLNNHDIRLFRDIVKYSRAEIIEIEYAISRHTKPINIIIKCLWNMVNSSRKFIDCSPKDLHIYIKHLRYIANIELFKNSFNKFVKPIGSLYRYSYRKYDEVELTDSMKIKLLNVSIFSQDNEIIRSFENIDLSKSYDILSNIFENVISIRHGKANIVKIKNNQIGEFKMYKILDLAILYTMIGIENKTVRGNNFIFSSINDIYIPKSDGHLKNPGFVVKDCGVSINSMFLSYPPNPKYISKVKDIVTVIDTVYNYCDIKPLRKNYLEQYTELSHDYIDMPESMYERLIFKYLTLPYTVYTHENSGDIRVVIADREYLYDNTFPCLNASNIIYELIDIKTGELMYFSPALVNRTYDKIAINTSNKLSHLDIYLSGNKTL